MPVGLKTLDLKKYEAEIKSEFINMAFDIVTRLLVVIDQPVIVEYGDKEYKLIVEDVTEYTEAQRAHIEEMKRMKAENERLIKEINDVIGNPKKFTPGTRLHLENKLPDELKENQESRT